MSRGRNIDELLQPIDEKPLQAFFGQGLHTLGLLGWLLRQTGKADVWVSSFSTSEPFLNGFAILKDKGLVRHSAILLDQRAARKTLHLEQLLCHAFEHVFLSQNHSKILLVRNERATVSVITSQNQTYGARAESTIITTDEDVFGVLMNEYVTLCGEGAVELDLNNGTGIITDYGKGIPGEDRTTGEGADDALPDWRPFGAEW